MNGKLVFCIFALIIFLILIFAEPKLGFGLQCRNGDCNVFASTSPIAMALGLVLLIFTLRFNQSDSQYEKLSEVRTDHRVVAYVIDIVAIGFSLGPLLALPAVIVEFYYSGSLYWFFERNYIRHSDYIFFVLPGFLICFTIFFYPHKCKQKNIATIGQYVVGYRNVSAT